MPQQDARPGGDDADNVKKHGESPPRDSMVSGFLMIVIGLAFCFLVGVVLLAALRLLGIELFG